MTVSHSDIAWDDAAIRASRVDMVHDHSGQPDIDRIREIADLSPDMAALDLVTGLGHVARAIAPFVGSVDAFDPDPEILKEAQAITEKSGITNIAYSRNGTTNLEVSDNHYDFIVARMALRHVKDPGLLIREAKRILKPYGRFVLIDCLAPPHPDIAGFQKNLMSLRDPSHITSLTLAELEILLERENFSINEIEIYPMKHNFETWARRCGAGNENVRMLAQTLHSASTRVKKYFRVVENGDRLISFVTWMILVLASPTTE